MPTSLRLTGAMVLTPEGVFERGDVHIADGRITEAFAAADGVDCTGLHILPGIVDAHGDAFEVEMHPRPGVRMPFDIAMRSVDRQLIANGITTAYHGLIASWEPGARSIEAARTFMRDLSAHRADLSADHRVQLRWETFAHEVIPDIAGWLTADTAPVLAFNDHTTETIHEIRHGDPAKLEKWANRAGASVADYIRLAEAAAARSADDVSAKIASVAKIAQRAGAVMLSHDDIDADARRAFRAHGVRIAEFPLTQEAAKAARDAGEHVIMGGPNTIRGGSHKAGLSAEDAVRDGLCTILVSDYYYPSQLHAAERLTKRGVVDMAAAWALISRNPAEAMGLGDRGAIATGRRADLVVMDCTGPWRIRHVIAGGALSSFA